MLFDPSGTPYGTSARNPAAKSETKFYWRRIVFKMKIPTKKGLGFKKFFLIHGNALVRLSSAGWSGQYLCLLAGSLNQV